MTKWGIRDSIPKALMVVFFALGVLMLVRGTYLWAAICLCHAVGSGLMVTATPEA